MALFVFGMSLAVAPVFAQETNQSTDYKAPLEIPREFFNGIHVAKDNPKFQMEAQHYCSPLKSGMFQCLLFDSTGAEAKLIGIERGQCEFEPARWQQLKAGAAQGGSPAAE